MAYCRWSDGDCYVYKDVNDRKGEVRCCSCSLRFVAAPKGGVFDQPYPAFIAQGPKEMIDHLKEHEAVGHMVPKYAYTRLQAEAKERRKKPIKYPVHFLTTKLMTTKGEILDNVLGNMPICGYHYNAHFRKLVGTPKTENGHAHPRDETTLDAKQVTCPECKSRLRTGLVAVFQKKPVTTSTTSKTS